MWITVGCYPSLAATPPPSTPRLTVCIGLLGRVGGFLSGYLGSQRVSLVGPFNRGLVNLPRRLLGLHCLVALDSTQTLGPISGRFVTHRLWLTFICFCDYTFS